MKPGGNFNAIGTYRIIDNRERFRFGRYEPIPLERYLLPGMRRYPIGKITCTIVQLRDGMEKPKG